MKSKIEEIIKECLPERVDETEAKFADDPQNMLGEGYSIGFNKALSQIDPSKIADRVIEEIKQRLEL